MQCNKRVLVVLSMKKTSHNVISIMPCTIFDVSCTLKQIFIPSLPQQVQCTLIETRHKSVKEPLYPSSFTEALMNKKARFFLRRTLELSEGHLSETRN